MDGAFAWLSDLLWWLANFVPRLIIVKVTHQGIAFKRGKIVIPLMPGLHVYWPFWTLVILYPVKRQSLDLPTQCIASKDGKQIVVSGIIIYEISDIETALASQWDVAGTCQDLARCALASTIREADSKDLEEDLSFYEETFAETCRERLSDYGVHVLGAGITDFAQTKAYTLFNGGQLASPQEE